MNLSIIIPLYNSEKFISKCIESLVNQGIPFSDYEIIIVNDGSTDGSESLVRSYSNTYNNIVLINQANQGNGAARNAGINAAKGKYLYFIDSDDYLAENVLNQFLKLLEDHNLDLIGFNSQVTTSSTLDKSNNSLNAKNLNPVNGTHFIKNHNYKAEVWWYIVRRSFFQKCEVKFYDRKFVQDSFITTTLLINANRILHVPVDAHRYRKHENSITKNKSRSHITKHIRDMFFAIEKLVDLTKNITDPGCLKRLKSRQQSYLFFLLMRFPKSNLSFKDLKEIIQKAKELKVYPLNNFLGNDYNGFKYQMLTFIINHSVLLIPFMFIYRIKKH